MDSWFSSTVLISLIGIAAIIVVVAVTWRAYAAVHDATPGTSALEAPPSPPPPTLRQARRAVHDARREHTTAVRVAAADLAHERTARRSYRRTLRHERVAASMIGSRPLGSISGAEGSVTASGYRVRFPGGSFSMEGMRATLLTSAEFTRRFSTPAQRAAVRDVFQRPGRRGRVGASAVCCDGREQYLVLVSPEVTAALTCSPNDAALARHFAARVTQAGDPQRRAALRIERASTLARVRERQRAARSDRAVLNRLKDAVRNARRDHDGIRRAEQQLANVVGRPEPRPSVRRWAH